MRFNTDKRRSTCDIRELNSEPIDSGKHGLKTGNGQRRISKFCPDQSSADKRVAKEPPIASSKRAGDSKEGLRQKRTKKARKSAKILTRNLNHLRRITQISLQNQSHQSRKSKPGFIPNVHMELVNRTQIPFNQPNSTMVPVSPGNNESRLGPAEPVFPWRQPRGKLGKLSLKSPKIMKNLVLESFLKTPHSFFEQESPKNHLKRSSSKKMAKQVKANPRASQSGSNGKCSDKEETGAANLRTEPFQRFQNCQHLLQKRQTRNRHSKSLLKSVRQNLNINRTRAALPPLPVTPSNLMKRAKKSRNGPKTILNFNIDKSMKTKISNFEINSDLNPKRGVPSEIHSKDVFSQASDANVARLIALNENLPKIGLGPVKENSRGNRPSQALRKKSKSEKTELGKFPLIRMKKHVQSRESHPKKDIRRFLAKLNSNKSLNGPNLAQKQSKKTEQNLRIERESLSRFRKFQSRSNLPSKNGDKAQKIISKIKDSREMRVMMKAWNIHSTRKTPKTRNLYKKLFRAVMTEEDSQILHPRPLQKAFDNEPNETGELDNFGRDEELPKTHEKDTFNLQASSPKLFEEFQIHRIKRSSWDDGSVLALESCILFDVGGLSGTKESRFGHYFYREFETLFFGRVMRKSENGHGNQGRVDSSVEFGNLEPFLAASHVIQMDEFDFLHLFNLKANHSKVQFSKLLDFYDGNFDVFQIKKIITQVIEICIFLENKGIGICASENQRKRKTRKSSFDGESLYEDFTENPPKSERSYFKCKTERDELSRDKKAQLDRLGLNKNWPENKEKPVQNEKTAEIEETKWSKFNLVDHLILEGDQVKIALNEETGNMFKKSVSRGTGKRGLRVVLGLFIFNFIFNQRKTLADVEGILYVLEKISRQKLDLKFRKKQLHKREKKKKKSILCERVREEINYQIIAQKVSLGFINILKKLLMTGQMMNLENLREFFERQEIGVKNMGNFSLSLSDLIQGFFHGKCVELFMENGLSDLQNFQRILMSKI